MNFTKQRSKSRGSALIYAIILLVPVMMAAVFLMELVFTDFTVSSSSIRAQQAQYNAEAGIEWGIKKLQLKNYRSDYLNYNLDNTHIMDGAPSFGESRNCFKAVISYSNLAKTFTIESTGKFGDTQRRLSESVKIEGLLTLTRKISAERFRVSTGELYFQIPSPPLGWLKYQDRFLVTGSEGVETRPEVYTYTQTIGIAGAQRVDNASFFQIYGTKRNRLPDIKTHRDLRGHWIPFGSNICYFVGEKNTDYIIDNGSLSHNDDSFIRGFKELSGNYTEGIFSPGKVRVVLVDGDLVLRGIRGDFEGTRLTLAERFLSELVIYCTGKVTIEDCDFRAYGTGVLPDRDINLSIHSREMEFKSGSEGNVISHLSGNASLIKAQEQGIIELIKENTTPYSNWTY